MKKCGVYKIVSPDNKVYVGASINLDKRIREHKRASSFSQKKLIKSFQDYGVNNHKFDIIEFCDKEELVEKEVHHGIKHNVLDAEKGLNLSLPVNKDGKGGFSKEVIHKGGLHGFKKGHKPWNIGAKLTKSVKNKISNSKKRCKAWNKNKKMEDFNASYMNHNSKVVLDFETGVFYNSASEAAKLNGLKRTTLQAMLTGVNKNKTNLKYV
mgnify:CR=1 FL=1